MKAFKEKKMKSTKKADPAFVINGYFNWKDATVGFRNHEVSGCHREAVEVIITLPSTTMNIGAHLSNQYIQEKELNRKMLIKILSCIITRNLQRPPLAVYSIRVFRFLPILIVFLTGIAIYITRAPCIGGGRAGGGGEGGG